jgi:hypothetical protein
MFHKGFKYLRPKLGENVTASSGNVDFGQKSESSEVLFVFLEVLV